MEMTVKTEPRKKSRVGVRIPVLLCADPNGRTVKGNALVTNLSSRGLAFDTDAELKSGDLLFLKVALPISVACQVRYVKGKEGGYLCGATIEKIGLLDNMKLKTFVKTESIKQQKGVKQ